MALVEHNHGVKSQLAKLLAMENLTVQHRADLKTAMFDVEARVLYLPIWRDMSNDLYDLLVVHEVGHALDTPADGWKEALFDIARRVTGKATERAVRAVKGFLNVIEDARIDKRQKRRYPGSRRNYIAGYKELLENDFFGTKGRDINSMLFIDRINVHFKGGVAAGVKFNAEEMKFIKQIEAAETFDEVIRLTEEVFAFSKDEMDQPRETSDDSDDLQEEAGDASEWEFDEEDDDCESSGNGSSDEESDEEDEDGEEKVKKTSKGKGQKDDSDEEEEDDESEDGDDSEDEDEDGETGSRGEGDINDEGGAGASLDEAKEEDEEEGEENIPESETERRWEEKSQNLVASTDTDFRYLNIPAPNMSMIVHDYKKVLSDIRNDLSRFDRDWHSVRAREMTKWKSEENSTISYLVKEFETRKAADTYSKVQIAKTGVINTNKLHSYRYSEDIFRRNTVIPAGKNHGFVMFLDWSGSMNWNINNTLRQLFTLVLFCKRVQIPFEVYTFRDPTPKEAGYNSNYGGPQHDHNKEVHSHWTYKHNTIVFDPFKLRNILSSRMSAAELNQMLALLFDPSRHGFGCDPMGGTPLNSALAIAPQIVEDFQKRTKVQIVNTIVLTDGRSNCLGEVHGMPRGDYSAPTTTKAYTNYLLEDEKLKKTYDLGKVGSVYGLNGLDGKHATSVLLTRLKERTGCNLVGFFLTSNNFGNEFRDAFGYGSNADFEAKTQKCWKENGFFPVDNAGYDKYFILSQYAIRATKPVLKIDEKMTKNTIAKNFMKYSSGKKVNRVLLRQFIDEIAS